MSPSCLRNQLLRRGCDSLHLISSLSTGTSYSTRQVPVPGDIVLVEPLTFHRSSWSFNKGSLHRKALERKRHGGRQEQGELQPNSIFSSLWCLLCASADICDDRTSTSYWVRISLAPVWLSTDTTNQEIPRTRILIVSPNHPPKPSTKQQLELASGRHQNQHRPTLRTQLVVVAAEEEADSVAVKQVQNTEYLRSRTL